ncbi:site-2 protease family protein [Poriferisphaera sp. WC338]|uniref:site-2 protease family protein n=1 Tax=Poriferisphaera sp. WC338 TaxID=3425129 RepID=UPI003D8133CC
MDSLLITNLFEPERRFFYFAWILIVTISIVLHELAHGWMAIRCGDDTPIRLKRMTGNPLVHMGPMSIFFLLVVGIAWGQMPVDHSRLRGKYAMAKVAAAGPSMNVLLMVLSLVALVILVRFGWLPRDEGTSGRLFLFLYFAASLNALLIIFNLMPVPPLDGSAILSDLHRGYRDLLMRPELYGMWMLAMIFALGLTWRVHPYVDEMMMRAVIHATTW